MRAQADRPEDLVEMVNGPGWTVVAVAIDGLLALVVATHVDGSVCHVVAERDASCWLFLCGGVSTGGGLGQHYSWCRSEVMPPGVIAAGWCTDAREVLLSVGDETVVVEVEDGAFAWLRGGVPRDTPVLASYR